MLWGCVVCRSSACGGRRCGETRDGRQARQRAAYAIKTLPTPAKGVGGRIVTVQPDSSVGVREGMGRLHAAWETSDRLGVWRAAVFTGAAVGRQVENELSDLQVETVEKLSGGASTLMLSAVTIRQTLAVKLRGITDPQQRVAIREAVMYDYGERARQATKMWEQTNTTHNEIASQIRELTQQHITLPRNINIIRDGSHPIATQAVTTIQNNLLSTNIVELCQSVDDLYVDVRTDHTAYSPNLPLQHTPEHITVQDTVLTDDIDEVPDTFELDGQTWERIHNNLFQSQQPQEDTLTEFTLTPYGGIVSKPNLGQRGELKSACGIWGHHWAHAWNMQHADTQPAPTDNTLGNVLGAGLWGLWNGHVTPKLPLSRVNIEHVHAVLGFIVADVF